MDNDPRSVYVLIAVEANKVKECIVLNSHHRGALHGIYHRLAEIYGGDNVSYWSLKVDHSPLSLWLGYAEERDDVHN